jgi:putative ABC transport system permease protein
VRFFLRWIRREIQNDGWWVFLFVISLSLGLFGFIGLESFRSALEENLKLNARSFLSADLAMSSRRKITEKELSRVRELLKPSRESHLNELFSMAATPGGSRLVQIKAIDSEYPLYGTLKLQSGKVIARGGSAGLEEKPRAWLYPELLSQLKIGIGDKVKIGNLEFEVADAVVDDSTQTFRMAGLAPKIYFSQKFLPRTGLIGFGTTASDVHLFQVERLDDEGLSRLARQLENEFQDTNLQFATPLDSAQETGRGLQTLLDYLGLVSLVAVALALVGIGYLIQLFLTRRISTLSLLRTLGLRAGLAESFVLLELCLLGLCATALVLPFSAALLPVLGGATAEVFPVPLHLRLTPSSVFSCVFLAVFLPTLIALPLLRPLRRLNLKQVLLDRELWQARPNFKDALFWLPAAGVYFGMSVWISHSLKNASFFCAGLLISAVIMTTVSFFALKWIPAFGRDWQWAQARLRLVRSRGRFAVVILSLSFGTLLLVLLPQVRSSLQKELASPEATLLPSLFLFDIQDDQVNDLVSDLRAQGYEAQNLSPLVRARILSVNGQAFERAERKEFASREEEMEARFRNRGVNLTFRGRLSPSEELAEGRWFSASPGPVAEISVEKRYAERVGLQIGDLLKFDVQGVEIEAKIVNLRSVKWNSFQPNFFISFQPGFLDEAPKTWLLSVPPMAEDRKIELQNRLVSRFPNVSIIDVSRVIAKVLGLTDQMIAALTGMAVLSVVVGLFMLFTVLMTEARARMVEWNLYKVLGANQKSILSLFLIESSAVSLLAVVLGGALGCLLSFVLVRWIFGALFQFSAPAFLGALAVPFALSLLISWRLGLRLTRTEASSLLAEGRL